MTTLPADKRMKEKEGRGGQNLQQNKDLKSSKPLMMATEFKP